MGKQRTEREWRRLVSAWRRGGEGAQAFAVARGVSAASLFRWARIVDGDKSPGSHDVRLVEAVPVGATDGRNESGWSWEIETHVGVLRSRGAIEAPALRTILAALATARWRGSR